MSTTYQTTPLSAGADNTTTPNNMPPMPNAAPEDINITTGEEMPPLPPEAMMAQPEAPRKGINKGVVAGAAGVAAVGAGVGAYIYGQGPEHDVEGDADGVADAASGIFGVTADAPEAPAKAPVSDGSVSREDLSEFQQSTIDHTDEEFAQWFGDDGGNGPAQPPHGGDVASGSLPDVNPDLLTQDLAEDVILIDDADVYSAPGIFFDPLGIEVRNIDGHMETHVQVELQTGEQVYLVDSDNDGSFDGVYDLDGNLVASGPDLTATTIDDAQAILVDKGIDVPDSNATNDVAMADINDYADNGDDMAYTDGDYGYSNGLGDEIVGGDSLGGDTLGDVPTDDFGGDDMSMTDDFSDF